MITIAILALALAPQVSDHEKGMRSKDDETRLATVAVLAQESDPKSEKLLTAALKDVDWEVIERAADALGTRRAQSALDELEKLALESPLRRHRVAAARALARIDAKTAAADLSKKCTGATELVALEALVEVVRGAGPDLDLKAVLKSAEKSKSNEARATAHLVLAAYLSPERAGRIVKAFDTKSVLATCMVLDEMAAHPVAGDLAILVKLLERDELDDTVERRAVLAARADIAGPDAATETWSPLVERLIASKHGAITARGTRLVRQLASSRGPATQGGTGALIPDERALEMIRPALAHKDAAARAAAMHTAGRLIGDGVVAAARKSAADDVSERVRYQALAALYRVSPPEDLANAAIAAKLLESDLDADVRTLAAVKLGKRNLSVGVDALKKALNDKDWGVGVAAAVSLGRTQMHESVQTLVAMSNTHADWKMRGAALVGLSLAYDKASIPACIAALGDADSWVARCALKHLEVVSGEKLGPKPEPWNAWWATNERTLLLADPEVVAARRKRFLDISTTAPEVYRELDVVVLESRGDHIENVLESQRIDHRMTRAGALPTAALSQDALLMMNCTGELEARDVERVRWFVLVGGHLFGTCWALQETISRAMPTSPIAKFETQGEVLANVPASPCDLESPFTAGVFAEGVEPIYALQGAHLIRVLDPERAEVLIDSPWCAETFGCGNLAAWFEAGHGTVLDSVNHFDLQGLELAEGLKTPRDRQAYAVDHMGYSYASLREARGEKYWDQAMKASQQVLDLSVFRLLTNFVRLRRAELTRH